MAATRSPIPTCATIAAAIDRAFVSCLDADLVLVTGGSSVGERDHVLDTIARRWSQS